WRALLLLREEERALLRARLQFARSAAAVMARRGAGPVAGGLEDLLFPPSAVLGRRPSWVGCGPSRRARADARQARRRRRVLRARPRLRADQTAEGHRLLRR